MNILLLADRLEHTGVGLYIRTLAHGLHQAGHEVYLAAPINSLELGKEDELVYISLHPMNSNPINLLYNIHNLHQVIQRFNIQVVHANHRMSMFVMRLYNLCYSHIPTIWITHTVPYPTDFLRNALAYYGDKCIAISSEAKKFLVNKLHIDSNKISLVLNGVDETKLAPLSAVEKRRLKEKWQINRPIVFALHGRIDPIKGFDVLIESLKKLSKNELSQILIICSGDIENNTYYTSLLKTISDNHLTDVFRFVGWCSARDILGISSVMLQPSWREGFPLAAIEAFFMQIPLIRTRAGGFEDMKNVCIGIPIGDSNTLAFHLHKIIVNPHQYDYMINDAYKFALENCSISQMVNKTISVYHKTIDSCKNGGVDNDC